MTVRLQHCSECGTVNYPSRTVCRHCLSNRLTEKETSGAGKLLAVSLLHHALEPAYDAVLPVRIGTVLLDFGSQVIAFVPDGLEPDMRVSLRQTRNPLGQLAWEAQPAHRE